MEPVLNVEVLHKDNRQPLYLLRYTLLTPRQLTLFLPSLTIGDYQGFMAD